MNTSSHVPPGFRFHPTDEELVDYYLRKKVNSTRIDLDVIKDVDLYKIEPWDLQELCRVGTEEQNEWYFFSHKDKKYPTGTRTNRATAAGFWKATGRDKAIYSKNDLIGMRKTLVFYKGRAPNGLKSDWIMHEYRLETHQNGTTPQEEGWVVCRVFKKRVPTTTTTMNMRSKLSEHDSPSCSWYDDQQVSLMQQDHYFDSSSSSSAKQISHHHDLVLYQQQQHFPFPICDKKLLDQQPAADLLPLDNNIHYILPREHFLHHHLPLLDNNPKMLQQSANSTNNQVMAPYDPSMMIVQQENQEKLVFRNNNNNNTSGEQPSSVASADWRVVDKFVSSQLIISQEDHHHHVLPTENNDDNNNNASSTSNSSSPMDLVWK